MKKQNSNADLAAAFPEAWALIEELVTDIYSIRNPKTGDKIQFMLHDDQNQILWWSNARTHYCYTPHADTTGNYWTFQYVKSGTTWRLRGLTRAARRKVAKARAYARYMGS